MTSPRPFEYPASGRVRTGTLYGSGPGAGHRPALVVVHGMFMSRAMDEIDRLCRLLASSFAVVSIDMRGHGDAPGPFTWGREEHRDLADLVAFLRALHPSVGVIGFSFGGSVAIISASLARDREDGARPDAVCTIGAPAHMELWRWRFRPAGALRHIGMMRRRRRRFRPGWPTLGWTRAVDHAAGVAPAPLLIVHGDSDWLVDPRQARQLYEAARPPRELLMVKGGLHAEYLITQDPAMVHAPVRRFFEGLRRDTR